VSRLLDLIDSGEFDWENLDHRTAYLKAWVKGEFSRNREVSGG
jgi:hypothetical protein